jgi:hypothetical protein
MAGAPSFAAEASFAPQRCAQDAPCYRGNDTAWQQRCLRGETPCDEQAQCTGRLPHSCLAASIPFWSQPLTRIRCCMRCCVRFWMRALKLGRNEVHWMTFAKRRGRRERSDDWQGARLQTHAQSGEVLFGEMDAAVLAHGNMLYSHRSLRARLELRPARHSNGQQRPEPFAKAPRHVHGSLLTQLATGSLVLLHSNEAEHAALLMEHLHNATALAPPRVAVSIISRDDQPIPTAPALRLWRAVRAAWPRSGVPLPQWFVQNVATTTARPGADGIQAFPIGVHNPNQLAAFLTHISPRELEAQVAQRRTLLMCCCMQADVPERHAALAALVRNGFPCNASVDQAPSRRVLRQALRSAGSTSTVADREAVGTLPSLRHSWTYYATALHSKFVASPAGHGRDCYRTWEALALGAVPVMRLLPNASADRSKFEDVPVVWVHDWAEVTPNFLEEKWRELRQRSAASGPSGGVEARGAHFPFWLRALTAGAAGTSSDLRVG